MLYTLIGCKWPGHGKNQVSGSYSICVLSQRHVPLKEGAIPSLPLPLSYFLQPGMRVHYLSATTIQEYVEVWEQTLHTAEQQDSRIPGA